MPGSKSRTMSSLRGWARSSRTCLSTYHAQFPSTQRLVRQTSLVVVT
jgi:hypothetical protein